jgi:hypothetical protein
MSKTCPDFFFTARVHTTKSTVKILAAKTHRKYILKIAEVTHFFLYAEPLVPEVCTTFLAFKHSRDVTALCDAFC